MVWLPRRLVAMLLAAIAVTLPLALQHCAISCTTEHSTAASSPDCHHTTPAIPQIGANPARCGHADGDTFSLAAGTSLATLILGISWDLPVRVSTVTFDLRSGDDLEVSPQASVILTALSSHLRI